MTREHGGPFCTKKGRPRGQNHWGISRKRFHYVVFSHLLLMERFTRDAGLILVSLFMIMCHKPFWWSLRWQENTCDTWALDACFLHVRCSSSPYLSFLNTLWIVNNIETISCGIPPLGCRVMTCFVQNNLDFHAVIGSIVGSYYCTTASCAHAHTCSSLVLVMFWLWYIFLY